MNNGQPTQHAKQTITITRQPAQKPNGAEARTAPSPERKDPTEVKSPEAAKPDPAPVETVTHQEQSKPENAKDTEAAPTAESNHDNKTDNSTATATANQQTKKRTRKTIDQELAELEQRRAKLLEAKRKNETREKIVFGATVIAMLTDMKKKDDENFTLIKGEIQKYAKSKNLKDLEIINKVISQFIKN